jgi:hypothetical protein
MGQANSAEEHKLVSSFEAVRRTLLQEKYSDRLDKPLAFWALPNDRRLPLAFLGRSVGELLQTPFQELTSTRGIGHKKISSLVRLLHRATNDTPPAVPYGLQELADELQDKPAAAETTTNSDLTFDPQLVSEALWVQWCDTVRRFHLGRETLGRLAPSLQALPTVIWNKPLGDYLGHSLSEIRQLKTHGEKRVRVVLEVFHSVNHLLANARSDSRLSLQLVPRFVPAAEDFIGTVRRSGALIGPEALIRHLIEPMLQQIEIDSGDAVAGLARHRLGVGAEPKSVREQSREMGVTRARVYQLLEDCAKVMEVRWPEGASNFVHLEPLVSRDAKTLYDLSRQLFFPEKSAAKSLAEADEEN